MNDFFWAKLFMFMAGLFACSVIWGVVEGRGWVHIALSAVLAGASILNSNREQAKITTR